MDSTTTVGTIVPRHGSSEEAPPLKDKCPGDQAEALKGNEKADTPNCTDAAAERKVIANLRAGLALAGGHALHQLADGTFLVTWRHLSRSLPDLNAVAAFAHQAGVRE